MNKNDAEVFYLDEISAFKSKYGSFISNLKQKYMRIATPYLNTVIAYLTNLAELSNQFARIQKDGMQISSILVSRSVFEECAIINKLIKESSFDINSFFYKHLYIKDMVQDININNGWNNEAEAYWRRIHNFLIKHFSEKVSQIKIREYPEDISNFTGYSDTEKTQLKKVVYDLSHDKRYQKYTITAICTELFNDVYSNTDLIDKDIEHQAICDVKVLYGQICHYTHLNLTAIDEFNSIIDENMPIKLCFEKKIQNNYVVLQWMK